MAQGAPRKHQKKRKRKNETGPDGGLVDVELGVFHTIASCSRAPAATIVAATFTALGLAAEIALGDPGQPVFTSLACSKFANIITGKAEVET